MKKLTSIRGEITCHCTGSFNFDSDNMFWDNVNLYGYKGTKANNYKSAKKKHLIDNGQHKFLPKISSNCYKKILFKDIMEVQKPELAIFPRMLYNHITTPLSIVRGYLYTNETNSCFGDNSLNKKGITISDLVANIEPLDSVHYELCTKSGFKKNSKKDSQDDAKSDTSLFYVEQYPSADYTAVMVMNMMDFQFLSCDDKTNRKSFGFINSDYKDLYFKSLKRNFKLDEVPEIKPYFLISNSCGMESCEEGIFLNDNMLNTIIKNLISSIINMPSYGQSNNVLSFKSLKLHMYYDDGTEDVIDNVSNEWLENQKFEIHKYFDEVSEDVLKERANALEMYDNSKKRKK